MSQVDKFTETCANARDGKGNRKVSGSNRLRSEQELFNYDMMMMRIIIIVIPIL